MLRLTEKRHHLLDSPPLLAPRVSLYSFSEKSVFAAAMSLSTIQMFR
jgi:hypothetical protein